MTNAAATKPTRLKPLVLQPRREPLDAVLATEWLRSNRLGAYSSSTIIGCNTRRYHGLLVAPLHPPVGRVMALSTVMEQLVIKGEVYELAVNEFSGTFAPHGDELLCEFRDDTAATFVYEAAGVKLTKRVLLHESEPAVMIRYQLKGDNLDKVELRVRPFTAMRDFHSLRSADAGHDFLCENDEKTVRLTDRASALPPLALAPTRLTFRDDPQWWYQLLYRVDLSRGQDGVEDLYSPGVFIWQGGGKKSCKLVASLGQPVDMKYKSTRKSIRKQTDLMEKALADQPRSIRRLAVAGLAYIVDRKSAAVQDGASILAGFPWFADWGRDTFIALPGLLLSTGRLDVARRVFRTYMTYLDQGMVPNCFDERGGKPLYNSIDASLWFIIAAERYARQADRQGDLAAQAFWREQLLPACRSIMRRYADGTRFDIHADSDHLLTGGSIDTQLTWMDAKLGQEVITSRYGKAVEINALWHSAHGILARRMRSIDQHQAESYAQLADKIAESFRQTFWNDRFGWLNDVVNDRGVDASLRPNQLLAVSLPYSPLRGDQQRAVVDVCREKLLTPFGLRTLSPDDPRYRRRYGGCSESRERAYHQGTVWAWLIGPFIEAWLKTAENPDDAVTQARSWLAAFDGHLNRAGLGQISEIFDGHEPHTPRGCFAQAWSIAEVLRAKQLVEEAAEK